MPPERARSKRKLVLSRRVCEIAGSSNITRPPLSRAKKQRPRVPKRIDLTSNDLPDLESTQLVSKMPSKPREPLPTKYTLSINILVGDVRIHSRTMLQTAGAFDYAGFMSIEARKTSEYCARVGRDVDIRSSTAKITYNKEETCQSDIDDPEDWRLFDELAGTYLQDKNKKDVQLSWTITCQLKALSVEPEKEVIELYEDESEVDTEDGEKGIGKAGSSMKKTATNQRLAEARAAPHSDTTNQLLELYKCRAPNCRNSSAYCLPVGGANDGHFTLNAHSIRQWVIAVDEGMATIHNPPLSLVNSIVNVQEAQKTTPLLPSTATPAPSPFALPPPPPYYSLYALPVSVPFGSAGPHGMLAEIPCRAKASKPTGSTSRPSSSESVMELRSSPTDPLILMSQYIAWYREKFPGQGALLDSAAERLELAAYDLHGITELRAEDWHRIGIPEGLGNQLARNVMRFRRQRDPN
ncbi:MAG: hypothetical protein M1813_007250 [Trichoglossum hirsutum]|nr:MAG: hypothetical protein M1813_007250 [Trichoglossum hirsutum]